MAVELKVALESWHLTCAGLMFFCVWITDTPEAKNTLLQETNKALLLFTYEKSFWIHSTHAQIPKIN